MRHDAAHKLAHVIEVHQHAAIFITVFRCSLIVIWVATAAVVLTKVQQESQQNARHHGFWNTHQVWRNRSFARAIVDAMVTAKAVSLHNWGIAAITGAASLRQEHVEIVVLMVSTFEAITAYWHARRCSTRSAAISYDMRYPDETTFSVIIIATYWKRE